MRIVHLVPAMEQGGVESVVCDLNRELVKAGYESYVISRGGRLVERILADGGHHIALDLRSKNPLTYFPRALKLRRILRSLGGPLLVCAHSRVPAWLFVFANRALGLEWITYAHGANSVSRYSAVMTKGDLVVTPSRFLAGFLKEHYPIGDEKIRVVNPMVDTERFDPAKLDCGFIEEKRREWGISGGEKVLMTVGRITPVKGLDALIPSVGPGEKLIIVGGADRRHLDYLERLKKLAGPNVVFAGPQAKIPECLSLADEVVSANTVKPESFGLSVAEAYAMNKPVSAKRFGGVAEIMSDVAAELASGRAADFRSAVRSLYGADRFVSRTLAVYAELGGKTAAG